MEQYIKKATLVAEIEKNKNEMEPERDWHFDEYTNGYLDALKETLSFIDTLEVKDPYKQCVQYDSIKAGIQAHAETYSFNIESKLFNQLTKEQQELWREEIEQACISGGEVGVELARDPRYKENLEVKEVDLEYNGKAMLHVLTKGVEQGKREILDKACEWIKYNSENGGCLFDGWEEGFRKAMEE